MRFLHSADWHLGRSFNNVSLVDDQAFVLDQFIELARRERVDGVILAGDVYDRANPPADAVALLDRVLHALVLDAKIPVFMIAGNHDSPVRLGFSSQLLAEQGLHIWGPISADSEPVRLTVGDETIYLCPMPYAEPSQCRLAFGSEELSSHEEVLRAQAAALRQQLPPGARSIAIAHCWVVGGDDSESERPLTVGGAGQVRPSCFDGFDYVALGHLHRPQSINRNIHYSGSLLKYSFSEVDHKKAVNLIEISGDNAVSIERIALTPRHDVRVVSGQIEALLAGADDDGAPDDYVFIRLTNTEAILDAVGKLRSRYPNILHLERVGLSQSTMSSSARRDHRARTEIDLFTDFFAEVTDDPAPNGTDRVMADVIESVRISREGRSK